MIRLTNFWMETVFIGCVVDNSHWSVFFDDCVWSACDDNVHLIDSFQFTFFTELFTASEFLTEIFCNIIHSFYGQVIPRIDGSAKKYEINFKTLTRSCIHHLALGGIGLERPKILIVFLALELGIVEVGTVAASVVAEGMDSGCIAADHRIVVLNGRMQPKRTQIQLKQWIFGPFWNFDWIYLEKREPITTVSNKQLTMVLKNASNSYQFFEFLIITITKYPKIICVFFFFFQDINICGEISRITFEPDFKVVKAKQMSKADWFKMKSENI